ncbi:MAG: hypothetical protein QOD06_2977 [Candidatus Binatota bacterium]|nr:hypothetical protein [Candidatus Binatota bacterium]
MKLLWIAPQPFYSTRGTPMNVRRLAEIAAGAGHEIDLVTYFLGEDPRLPASVRILRSARLPFARRVPIGPSLLKLPLDLLVLARAFSLLRDGTRYDALHGFEEGAWIAALLGRWRRIPFVYDMDSDLEEQTRIARGWYLRGLAPLVAGIDRWALRRAAVAVTVCATLSERARRLAPGVPIHQIEDAPNVAIAADAALARAEVVRRWSLPPGELVVYTGNLEPYQGVELLVQAAPRVLERRPMVVFLVVGGEVPQVEALRALAVSAGGRVVITGARPESEMPAYLAAADVLVSPRSQGTNTPLKLYSYLLSGKPLVATDRPVHTQVVSAEEAMLAEPSPEGIAGGILALLESPELREAIAARARRLAETRFGPGIFRDKALAFLEALEDRVARAPRRGAV